MKKTIDLNELRSEYESAYLAYVPKRIKDRGGEFGFAEWAIKEKGVELFEVSTFDEADEESYVIEGDLVFDEAKKMAEDLWSTGNEYGVQIISLDPENMEPIVWIKSKYREKNPK
jgi:hypothetical protein